MDFSKRGTANKQRNIHSTSQKLSKKALISFLRTCIVCIVAISIIGTFTGLGALKGMLDSAPSIDSIDVKPSGFSTIIYDSEGNEIQKLVGSQANRIYVDLKIYLKLCKTPSSQLKMNVSGHIMVSM